MRFCLDARTARDHFPGVGRYAINLARGLAQCLDGSETLVVLRDRTSVGPWNLDELAHPQVRLVDAPVSPFALRQQWQVPRLLRRLDAGLYHSPYYLMPFRPGVPSVVTIHDVIPLQLPAYFTHIERFIFGVAVRFAIHAARTVIAVSSTTARDLRELLRVPAERVVTIPEAADPTFFPQSPEIIAAMRGRLSLPARYVLYVGSNKPHKNLVKLIEAWGRLQPQPLPLVIAGVWDARYSEARQRVEALELGDYVRFVGPVAAADLAALYSGATLFVFPSEYEGFGLPVIEAMACGVPVACSNTASLREVAGDSACLFDPHDVASITAAMRLLLRDTDRRADLATRGVRRAAQLSWRDAARMTLDVYRSARG